MQPTEHSSSPYFSICIPQYNRTSHLLKACSEWQKQTCQDFEICISDDCSPDGRTEEIRSFLASSGMRYTLVRQQSNLRYDGNLRAAISLSTGTYCLLMGNDDAPAYPELLEDLKDHLDKYPNTGVLVTNYRDVASGREFLRVKTNGSMGHGPLVAASSFRNLSFVSGLILRKDPCRIHCTERWDGSEMYQMHLACSIVSDGYDWVEFNNIAILQGLQVPGENVDSYARKPRLEPCPIVERPLPLNRLGQLVCSAVMRYSDARDQRLALRVFFQLLCFTYPFWLIEYRRVQSWRYAVGIAIGMRPNRILEGLRLSLISRTLLRCLYAVVSVAGLITPLSVFDVAQTSLYRMSKAAFRSASA